MIVGGQVKIVSKLGSNGMMNLILKYTPRSSNIWPHPMKTPAGSLISDHKAIGHSFTSQILFFEKGSAEYRSLPSQV